MQLITLAENIQTPIGKMCVDSLLRHNPDAKVFTFESIADLPGGREFLAEFRKLSLVHFSDIFRVWYLYHFGGAWIDADCFHLRTMEHAPMRSGQVGYIYQDHHRRDISNCYMQCPEPGNRFLKLLLERQIQLVKDKGPAGLQYLDLGEWSINHLRSMLGDDMLHFSPHWEHQYIAWYNSGWFHQTRHWGDFQFDRGLYNPNAYCYHLTNRIISEFGHFPQEDLLNHNSFCGFLARRSLGNGFDGCKDSAILKRLPDVHCAYRYCEVGVYKGCSTAIIGQQRNRSHVTAVDPWRNVASEDYRKTADYIAFMSDADHDQAYQEAQAHNWFLLSQQRIDFVRTTSIDASTRFGDGHFDMVFIDGDHSKRGCEEDIKAWWPKVRSGGWLAGHDYDHPGFVGGVKDAVDEFAAKLGLPVELDTDWTWFVRKP